MHVAYRVLIMLFIFLLAKLYFFGNFKRQTTDIYLLKNVDLPSSVLKLKTSSRLRTKKELKEPEVPKKKKNLQLPVGL